MSLINYEFTPQIICPYCGKEHGEFDGEILDGTIECKCGKIFDFVANFEVTFTSYKKDEENL